MTDRPVVGVLSHLRILDLTCARASPTCCRIFADFGVDLIKIDVPSGFDSSQRSRKSEQRSRFGVGMLKLHQ
jgi:crotonobetainyl-CoA:carnitine CoA-transferase CaiB-like acyl-CoA transferase